MATLYQWRDSVNQQPVKKPYSATPPTGMTQPAVASPEGGAQPMQRKSFADTLSAPIGHVEPPKQRTFSDLKIGVPQMPQMQAASQPQLSAQRQQAMGAAYGAIAQALQPQTDASESETLARNQYLKAQADALRQVKEQGATMGQVQTGQMPGVVARSFEKTFLPARAEFEAGIRADEAARRSQDQAQAIQGLGTLEQAQLGQQQLAQQASQFSDQMAFNTWATQEGFSQEEAARAWQTMENQRQIQSQEKISFAGLSLEEKALAQEATQFTSRIDFDRWATQAGLDENQKARIWQGVENERDRIARAEESGLARELQRYIADRGFEIDDRQISETIRQFDSKLDFDKWATQAGLDEQEKDRVHQARLQDIEQSFLTGERIAAQDWSYIMEDLSQKRLENTMRLEQSLNLDTLEKQNSHDTLMMQLQQQYAQDAQIAGFSHDKEMTTIQNEYATALQQMGYTQQQAMQSAQIMADSINLGRELTFKQTLAAAEMMQNDMHFMAEMGVKRDQLDITKQQITDELGLKKEMWENEKLNQLIDKSAMLLELSDGNQDMTNMATEYFINAIAPDFGWTDDQKASAMQAMKATATEITQLPVVANADTKATAYDNIILTPEAIESSKYNTTEDLITDLEGTATQVYKMLDSNSQYNQVDSGVALDLVNRVKTALLSVGINEPLLINKSEENTNGTGRLISEKRELVGNDKRYVFPQGYIMDHWAAMINAGIDPKEAYSATVKKFGKTMVNDILNTIGARTYMNEMEGA